MAALPGAGRPCRVRTGSESPPRGGKQEVSLPDSLRWDSAGHVRTYLRSKVRPNVLIPTFPFFRFSSCKVKLSQVSKPTKFMGFEKKYCSQTAEIIAWALTSVRHDAVCFCTSHFIVHRNPSRRAPIGSLFYEGGH